MAALTNKKLDDGMIQEEFEDTNGVIRIHISK